MVLTSTTQRQVAVMRDSLHLVTSAATQLVWQKEGVMVRSNDRVRLRDAVRVHFDKTDV